MASPMPVVLPVMRITFSASRMGLFLPGARVEVMAEHKAIIRWTHSSGEFLKGRYSREHTWTFDGGMTVQASPSPSVVPQPYCNPAFVDPEEAYVASIASCHMLTYLHVASRAGFEV